MGRDITMALAREGADVALGARTESKLEELAAEVTALGRRAVWASTDVSDEAQCNALAELAERELGRIDVLVNNAFVQPPFETLEEATLETWTTSLDVNLLGAVRMTRAVIPAMKRQTRGSIVFINSMSSRRVRPFFGVYSAGKAALLTTARIFAKELGQSGIRVNSVVPGYIWGPSLEWFFETQAEQRGLTPQAVYDEVAAETCLHHIPTSAEIADAVVFFASDLSRVVTGQSLDVNAGHWFE
jgi:NAD(P)-dependent dehydrogenase (short-subunit alcohol dehydrogenase family)